MNNSGGGTISVPSHRCDSGVKCIIGGEMALIAHFCHRTYWHAWMDSKEISQQPVSVGILRKALVLNGGAMAWVESLWLPIWKLESKR